MLICEGELLCGKWHCSNCGLIDANMIANPGTYSLVCAAEFVSRSFWDSLTGLDAGDMDVRVVSVWELLLAELLGNAWKASDGSDDLRFL